MPPDDGGTAPAIKLNSVVYRHRLVRYRTAFAPLHLQMHAVYCLHTPKILCQGMNRKRIDHDPELRVQ